MTLLFGAGVGAAIAIGAVVGLVLGIVVSVTPRQRWYLMKRLGYDRYFAQGGDWGGQIVDLWVYRRLRR